MTKQNKNKLTDDRKLASNQSASVWGVVDRPEEIEISIFQKLSPLPKKFVFKHRADPGQHLSTFHSIPRAAEDLREGRVF